MSAAESASQPSTPAVKIYITKSEAEDWDRHKIMAWLAQTCAPDVYISPSKRDWRLHWLYRHVILPAWKRRQPTVEIKTKVVVPGQDSSIQVHFWSALAWIISIDFSARAPRSLEILSARSLLRLYARWCLAFRRHWKYLDHVRYHAPSVMHAVWYKDGRPELMINWDCIHHDHPITRKRRACLDMASGLVKSVPHGKHEGSTSWNHDESSACFFARQWKTCEVLQSTSMKLDVVEMSRGAVAATLDTCVLCDKCRVQMEQAEVQEAAQTPADETLPSYGQADGGSPPEIVASGVRIRPQWLFDFGFRMLFVQIGRAAPDPDNFDHAQDQADFADLVETLGIDSSPIPLRMVTYIPEGPTPAEPDSPSFDPPAYSLSPPKMPEHEYLALWPNFDEYSPRARAPSSHKQERTRSKNVDNKPLYPGAPSYISPDPPMQEPVSQAQAQASNGPGKPIYPGGPTSIAPNPPRLLPDSLAHNRRLKI
ncbi:hypothetical protein PUNSTDRAFT_140814 [Punctularia strigosozonata HHB-11173 SS5]|uniref:uncharacterized protein n=1 Tax=Punctularia strigosozonata (strain HHB-11173) TaxID=741275 RepID=UPI0004417BA5|nr:uncharacterized protein PUNSTDRAFT_140814 [Punctularia strigosozonata HHB-11173 SS5]EIN14549.1 hypothetical protein PUNSTDRAFT_140814 [Punctularia strigosozonata HHB-11173 SS5]